MFMFLVACSLKSKFMWHCLVDYWVCYCMFCSMGTKVFPRVEWLGLMVVGLAYPSLRLVRGIITEPITWFEKLCLPYAEF